MTDSQYEDLLALVSSEGSRKTDRTGTGTLSVFGQTLRYDLADGFPLITTKKVNFRSVVVELLWFLRGDTNIGWLHENNVRIWDEWADPDGNLGPIYGHQWRSWPVLGGSIDQIDGLIRLLRANPDSRRLVVSAWNVADLPDMALEPCHMSFQAYVAGGRLSLQVTQRSADLFLGVPFNIASYALLTHMLAAQVGLRVGELVWLGNDCHIYRNHMEQVETQLLREPFPFPSLTVAPAASIDGYTVEDFTVHGYQHHPAIEASVAR